ncbi:MAG: ROK family protein [Succinivibrio sp.]|jgi:polyphosphate glucokinase|nr:ROK family protein [Succinivibrio sp.]
MQILGVDIGGTGIKGAVVETSTGELVTERERILTPHPATPEAVADTLCRLIDKIGFKGPVGCGFPARIINGTVLTASNIDKSWVNVPIEQLFKEKTGREVYAANDADVAGLCELECGAAKGVTGSIIFLTIGTGIGSALFMNGQMYPNTELGQLEYKGGPGEKYCSGAVKEKEDLKWKAWGKRFNGYLKYVDYLLKPDLFVLGGGASKKFEKFREELDSGIRVIPAQHLNSAGIIGAALYCERRLKGVSRF